MELTRLLKMSWAAWRRFIVIWILATILLSLGVAEPPLTLEDLRFVVPLVIVATFVGSVVYVSVRALSATMGAYYVAWAAAGVTTALIIAVAIAAMDRQMHGWQFWLAAAGFGCIIGIAYGWTWSNWERASS